MRVLVPNSIVGLGRLSSCVGPRRWGRGASYFGSIDTYARFNAGDPTAPITSAPNGPVPSTRGHQTVLFHVRGLFAILRPVFCLLPFLGIARFFLLVGGVV